MSMNFLASCIERGRFAWAAWLPVLCACGYVLFVAANISGINGKLAPLFSLGQSLHAIELTLMFILAPAFFTRFGNALGLILSVYMYERFMAGETRLLTTAQSILLVQTCVLAVLADRMPWVGVGFSLRINQKLREVLLQILAIFFLIASLYALFDLRAFHAWFLRETSLALNQAAAFSFVFGVLALWLFASINLLRSFSLFMVAYPSVLCAAFVLDVAPGILIGPFVLTIALALTQIRRQYVVQG